MTNKEFKSNLIKVIGQDTNEPSITNKSLTKKQVWHRLMRQVTTAPNEEGYPADRDTVNEQYVKIFNKEFGIARED